MSCFLTPKLVLDISKWCKIFLIAKKVVQENRIPGRTLGDISEIMGRSNFKETESEGGVVKKRPRILCQGKQKYDTYSKCELFIPSWIQTL